MRPSPFLLLFLAAAVAGCFFSGWSSYDFIQHLDRQVHGIHCSFIPGVTKADLTGSSGCAVTMMSPYSSILRSTVWGGIPISLGGFSVFAWLLYRGLDILLQRRERERGTTGFLALGAVLPFMTSLGMGWLSIVELGAACKLCIGIYLSSTLALAGAVGMWRRAVKMADGGMDSGGLDGGLDSGGLDSGGLDGGGIGQEMPGHLAGFASGVAFVAAPALLYLALAPDYSRFIGVCGELPKPEDPNKVMVALDQNLTGIPTVEIFDPLCPSCRGFESRLDASGLAPRLHRSAVLFPLDNTCNWMVQTTMHPGACTVSEAILCADEKRVDAVIGWAFENQEEIRAEAAAILGGAADTPEAAQKAADQAAAATTARVTAAFPELKACVGSARVRQKLNQSLRWAVANRIPVLTPQVYVRNQKLCDEDTDLGMDWALARLIEREEKR